MAEWLMTNELEQMYKEVVFIWMKKSCISRIGITYTVQLYNEVTFTVGDANQSGYYTPHADLLWQD
jgi:hypothetical protein